jgi:hypothetical protein
MANENIGDIKCPFCSSAAHVRRYSARKPPKEGEGEQRGKFYIHCADCGPILASSKRVQEYILDKGRMYGAEKPKNASPPAPAAPAAPKGAASTVAPSKPGNAAAASAVKKPIFDDSFFD